MNLQICFVAPSGYGKSTASEILIKEYGGCVIKIAEPLYDLQRSFYSKLGILDDKQDGELLQFYGRKVRDIKPGYLLDIFCESVRNLKDCYNIIVNDDCRPLDYDCLKELGFIFVRVNGLVRDRDDFTKANPNNSLEWQNDIPCDYELNNYGSIEEYTRNIIELIEVIKNDRQVLHYSSREAMQC